MYSKLQDINETSDERDKRLGIKCPKQNYHWAELKSSLYVKYMIDDHQGRRNDCKIFWRIIAETLIPAGNNIRDNVIDRFIVDNRNRTNQYPIGGYLNKLFEQQ